MEYRRTVRAAMVAIRRNDRTTALRRRADALAWELLSELERAQSNHDNNMPSEPCLLCGEDELQHPATTDSPDFTAHFCSIICAAAYGIQAAAANAAKPAPIPTKQTRIPRNIRADRVPRKPTP